MNLTRHLTPHEALQVVVLSVGNWFSTAPEGASLASEVADRIKTEMDRMVGSFRVLRRRNDLGS